MSNSPKGSGELRQLMEGFIEQRLHSKIEKLAPDDPRYEKLLEQFQFENWIDDAARRVGQLQMVTHSLKAIHPDAKGTNLYVVPASLTSHPLVGSHLLTTGFDSDVVGNAAALDVYKFLRLEHEGQTLLSLAQTGDEALKAALSNDEEQAEQWLRAFAAITEAKGDTASHTRAKQLYWLAGDDPTRDSDYHLLAPLYATSLAHQVFRTLNEDRFGETTKLSRKAQKDNQYSEQGYRVYPDLAVQKLGGTKPQNISQLNSERGGTNYLLASLPPLWQSPHIAPLRQSESAFYRFNRRPEVRYACRNLIRFLKADPANNMHTRNRVDELVDLLLDELVLFTAEIHQLTPGWSNNAECKLPEYQRLWLDRDADTSLEAWQPLVTEAFARWLNNKLVRAGLEVSDAEHNAWKQRMTDQLKALQELPHV